MRGVVLCALALFGCIFASAKGLALGGGDGAQKGAAFPTASVSRGLPWQGRLGRGVLLQSSAVVRQVEEYASGGNFYGTSELVSLLERAASAVALRWPGSQLAVGELSSAGGGKLSGHHSHRNGRDADVAFYMKDRLGRASSFRRFVAFGSDGLSRRTSAALYFDDEKNWALVSAMLRDPQARVQYMFVAKQISTRLLMEGRRRGESDEFLRAAAAVMIQPKTGNKHASHFHVRIYCARDDRPQCEDSAPYWPWYDGTPPDGQYAELPTIRWRTPSVATPRPAAEPRASAAPRTI